MVVPLSMPKLGWGTEPIEIVEWAAKEGDWIEQGDTILVITVEKVTSEVEANASGYLHILVDEGNKAPISSVVGLIAKTREGLKTIQREKPKEVITKVTESKESTAAEATSAQVPMPTVAKIKKGEHIRISPVARKMAEEHMIDITSVVGTGPGGRIVREDIEKAKEAKKE